MSYSALPQTTDYQRRNSIASSASSSYSYQPGQLELLGFEGPALSSDVASRPALAESATGFMSPVRPGTGSGASYEMVGNSSDEEEEGKENMRTGKAYATRRISKGDDITSPGVLVPSSSQLRLQEDSTKHNYGSYPEEHAPDGRSVDSKVLDGMDLAGQQKTLEMQLDGRADADLRQRGHVSDHHIQHRPYRSSHQLPPLPPAEPGLGLTDQPSGPPTSSDGVHPAFRNSQSFPQLPPLPAPEPASEQHERRPATSAANRGTDLFDDFDGVHFSPDQPDLRFSFAAPPPPPQNPNRSSQRISTPNSDSQRSANLVFYPAPVPAMLNLPPTLSKPRPSANNRSSRHIPDNVDLANNRRSVAYPGAGASGPAPVDKDMHRRSVASFDQLANRRSIANLPPALRASQFFDSLPMPPIVPEVKEESAVATLDSILDASARAPPAAFTDHPMMGGSAVPSHMRNRSSTYFGNNYRNSMAVTVKLHPGESPRSSMEDETREDARSHLNPESVEFLDSQQQQQQQNRHSFASSDYTGDPTHNAGPGGAGLPTTLLAELESRKAQQRSRNRTAASAFPAGIRSTLLELDAVAQIQKETRSKQKTHLAWEDPAGDHDPQDDDVPLGILYSVPSSTGQKQRRPGDDDVPLGLLVKKEMEDAEPLSKRRERLRGQSSFVQPQPRRSFLDVPGIAAAANSTSAGAADEEVEGETLKQRMKRLKEQKEFGTGTLGVEFTPATPKPSPPPSQSQPAQPQPAVEVEETLGQRRRRLQREAAAKREAAMLQQEVQNRRFLQQQQQQFASSASSSARPISYYSGHPTMGMGMGGVGVGAGMGMGVPGTPAEAVLDPKQREVVERWRASVM